MVSNHILNINLGAHALVVGSTLSALLASIDLELSKVTSLSTGDIANISVVDGRNPANRLPGTRDLGVELINLFQGKTLGLVDTGVNEDGADEAEATPDEEHLGLKVGVTGTTVHHVGGGVGDGPVEQPVGSGGDGKTLGTSLEGEQFTSNDPGDRTPGAGKEEDVDADKGDEDLVGDVVINGGTDDGDDQLRHTHANGTEQQKRATTPLLDHVKTGEGRHDVDDVGDQGDHEGVLDAGVLEEGGAVVEDEVDTSELLQTLDGASGSETLAESTAEDLEVGSSSKAHLELVVCLDLGQLGNDRRVVHIHAAKASEGLGGLLVAVLLDQETRCLGKNDHSNDKDDGPGKLNSDRDTVRASVVAVLSGVVDNGSEKQTKGDSKLVSTNNGTTDPLRGGLGLVKGDGCGEQTDTQTGKETTGNEEGNRSGNGLENDTKDKDETLHDHTQATTKLIRDGGSEEGTEEGTGGEERHDHRGLGGSNIREAIRLVDVTGREGLTPVLHG